MTTWKGVLTTHIQRRHERENDTQENDTQEDEARPTPGVVGGVLEVDMNLWHACIGIAHGSSAPPTVMTEKNVP